MLDLKITGGQVLNGTGSPPVRADVGIQDDVICDVGDLSSAEAKDEIRADGHYVCPGFIDAHSHSDAYLLIEPSAPSKTFQGITTEVVGQCGASAAPLAGAYRMPSDWRDQEYPGSWGTVREYRRLLEAVGPAPNVVLLIGHNTIRAGAMGYETRQATPEDLSAMKRLLEQALDEGGRGLTTGLLYEPGRHAATEEIRALLALVAGRDGVYGSHMRSESGGLLEAVDEVLQLGRKAGVRTEISHLKASGRRNWHLMEPAFERIEKAREEGCRVAADRYPYTAACTELDIVLPDWTSEGGPPALLARLRDPDTRARIRVELAKSRDPGYWETVTVGSTFHADTEPFAGKPIPEVAEALSVSPAEAVLYLVEKDGLKTGGIFFGMSEENMWKVLGKSYVMLGSDASLRAPTGPLSHDHPHPRAYGTFPKFLRAALEGKTVPLAEAVRKMTSLPAAHFGLKGRGRIESGAMADVVLFNPKSVRDTATYEKPHQLAEGITTVIVNGVVTIREGQITGERGGQFLD